MKTSEMVDLIDKWRDTYMAGYTVTCEYIGYAGLGDKLGLCSWKDRKIFNIYVNKIFEKDKFTTKVILWHEFCHMMDVAVNGDGGHDWGWFKCWTMKNIYTIPAYIIIFPNVIRRYLGL